MGQGQGVLEISHGDALKLVGNGAFRMIRNAVQGMEDESYREVKKLNDEKDKLLSVIRADLSGPFNDLLRIAKKLNDNLKNFSQKEVEAQVKELNMSAEQNYKILNKLLE